MFFKYKSHNNKLKKYFFYSIIGLITPILLIKLESLIYYKINSLFIDKIKLYTLKNLDKTEVIDHYLASIPSKYEEKRENERKRLENFLSLKNLSEEGNSPEDIELKNQLINKLTNNYKKNFNYIKSIFLSDPGYFGNRMAMLNNIIFYFEILNISNIYLNSHYNWFIRKNITTDKINILLISSSKINCNSKKVICISLIHGILLDPLVIKSEMRLILIKNEIQRNLLHVDIDPNDLYIHFRTGDIFYRKNFASTYAQPPLCFYQNILNNFKFKNIYIISSPHNNNPVINVLIKEFPNIINKKNSLEKDISILCHSYNLVASASSFFLMAIKFNDNLKNYWEYDIFKNSHKIMFYHHDFYNIPIKYTIYKMKPSENYHNEMFAWRNSKKQNQLMIEEKCINKFTIIKPDTE